MHIKVYIDFAYVASCMYITTWDFLIYVILVSIQNKHILHMQTSCMLASFLFWWNKFLSMIYRDCILSCTQAIYLTYNGAIGICIHVWSNRREECSYNVHIHNYYIQPLNSKSKLSLLPSLDNPAELVYYNNSSIKF